MIHLRVRLIIGIPPYPPAGALAWPAFPRATFFGTWCFSIDYARYAILYLTLEYPFFPNGGGSILGRRVIFGMLIGALALVKEEGIAHTYSPSIDVELWGAPISAFYNTKLP